MGLDQSIYRISKPKLEDKMYTYEEIGRMNLSSVSSIDFETNQNLFGQLVNYAIKKDLVCKLYDIPKMIADYNLPKDSHIWHYADGYIEISGYDENGERVNQKITDEDVRTKYTKTEIIPHYIWKSHEEHYWRKNYELQDWIYEAIGGIENTGYYMLDAYLINNINDRFGAGISEEEPTEESALFYWEWY
jgi:hypothetical protein